MPELADWFERISETAQSYTLERAVRYDKLGVNQSLLEFQIEMERKRLVSPEMFLPLLDRVAQNATFLNMALPTGGESGRSRFAPK